MKKYVRYYLGILLVWAFISLILSWFFPNLPFYSKSPSYIERILYYIFVVSSGGVILAMILLFINYFKISMKNLVSIWFLLAVVLLVLEFLSNFI